MMPNPRHSALAFLLGEHQLEPAEAEEALAVAAPVLDSSLARLLAAAEARHSAACAEAAHSLKGNLLNLGLPELAQLAQHATDMARQGNLPGAQAAGRALAASLAPLLPAFSPGPV
jgi:HPt (histidine-containing phosphotransfer) domain-containing protein